MTISPNTALLLPAVCFCVWTPSPGETATVDTTVRTVSGCGRHSRGALTREGQRARHSRKCSSLAAEMEGRVTHEV